MWTNNEGRVPTTDEMDEFDPQAPNAYDVMIQCGKCGEWFMFDKRNNERDRACQNCGSKQFVINSIISYRTFDLTRAKKATARIRKENEKRRSRL